MYFLVGLSNAIIDGAFGAETQTFALLRETKEGNKTQRENSLTHKNWINQ